MQNEAGQRHLKQSPYWGFSERLTLALISLGTLRAAAVIGSLKAAGQAEQVSSKHLVGNGGSRAQLWSKWAEWSAGGFRKIRQWLNKRTENRSKRTDF